jgi:hypothetical protein
MIEELDDIRKRCGAVEKRRKMLGGYNTIPRAAWFARQSFASPIDDANGRDCAD